MFDEAIEHLFDEDLFIVPTRKIENKNITGDVQHLICGSPTVTVPTAYAGAAATSTNYQEANTPPPFSTPTAPGLVAKPTNISRTQPKI